MSRGCASAWATASLVISWNRTRRTLPPFESWLATCQAMASPSRSGSVARSTRSEASASAATSAPSLSPGLPPGSAFFRFTPAFLPATYQSFVKRHESASLPSGTRLRKPDDLVHHLLRRFAVGVNLRVRTAIERLTRFLQQPHPLHRILSH